MRHVAPRTGVTATFADAVSGFASNIIFFMILLLLVGRSTASVGLDEWTATRLISRNSTPKKSARRLSSTILLLAFVMPSGMARTITVMPIIDQINELYEIGERSRFRRLAYYAVGHLTPVGSLALMTGGGMSLAVAGVISSLVRPITWVEWVMYMTPPVVLLFGLSFVGASVVYRVNGEISVPERSKPAESTDTNESGDALTREQRLVAGMLAIAIFLWVVGSFVGLPMLVPVMLVVLVFSLPGVRIITSKDVRAISWDVIFLIGAMSRSWTSCAR